MFSDRVVAVWMRNPAFVSQQPSEKNTPILRSWLGIAVLSAVAFMDPRENRQVIKKEYDLEVLSMWCFLSDI